MSTMEIKIPESIRGRLERIAKADGVSIDSFVATVLSQRVAFEDINSYVQGRARRGSAAQLLELLDKAPDAEPEPSDRIIKKGEQVGAGDAEEAV
jgi:hypothetical protein